MALTTCRECAKEISTEATVCPHCGAPHPAGRTESTPAPAPAPTRRPPFGALGGIALILGVLLVLSIIGRMTGVSPDHPSSPTDAATAAANALANAAYSRVASTQDAVKARLKDPESAHFDNVRPHDLNGTIYVCGTVNAKNGFGGYTGVQAFIGTPSAVLLESEERGAAFTKVWNTVCHAPVVAP